MHKKISDSTINTYNEITNIKKQMNQLENKLGRTDEVFHANEMIIDFIEEISSD